MTTCLKSAAILLVTGLLTPLTGERLICAGQLAHASAILQPTAAIAATPALPSGGTDAPAAAARLAETRTTGTRQALVLFARSKGEPDQPVPYWATDILCPDRPGSFSHFYNTMSFGQLQVRGQVAPRVYESAHEASFYPAADDTTNGRYDPFAREILQQADQDIDLAQYDNDGPDGIPNSGDDDGVVDAVFLVLDTVTANFLLGPVTSQLPGRRTGTRARCRLPTRAPTWCRWRRRTRLATEARAAGRHSRCCRIQHRRLPPGRIPGRNSPCPTPTTGQAQHWEYAGQVVCRLVDQVQPAGRYEVAWDGTADQGGEVGSGVYLYRLEAGPLRQTRRLVLAR